VAEKKLLSEVDDAARRSAKTLIRTARFGALATLDPTGGMPMASRVSLVCDVTGAPVFLISRLSGHFAALEADPRASLLLGEPGRGDPLAHARITVSGRAQTLEPARAETLRARYLLRHPKAALYAGFADFMFWCLQVERASMNAGFGKAFDMAAGDMLDVWPDAPNFANIAQAAVTQANADHSAALEQLAIRRLKGAAGNWKLTGLDREGTDLAAGDAVLRHWFSQPLASAAGIHPALDALINSAAT
jgi:heme oxygenase (biliverdin-IX-beta and delta-forming)